MGLQPNIARKRNFQLKTCQHCHQSLTVSCFAPTANVFYTDGSLPFCNGCIADWLEEKEFTWDAVDKLCQWADIPFVPKEWQRLYDMNGATAFQVYAEMFASQEYEGLGWKDYYEAFLKLKEQKALETELPGLSDEHQKELRRKWGANYDDEALSYLEDLYNGLMLTQNVNGKLSDDQAKKICKISYEIDCRIREGSDFDKLLSSYDKLIKAADFTPKNVKNINDFDSVGELIKWLEKRGWRNRFYDNVTRDIVDETIKNFQNFNQRLYTNESGIGEQITERLNSLKQTAQLEAESYYDTNREYDLDNYDNDGYSALMKEEDFDAEIIGEEEYG